jgi:hypothetical protein
MVNENKPMEKERSFSIELKSKGFLKSITLNNEFREKALIEGTIGELEHAEFVDDVILEVLGSKGILRIDIGENEIRRRGKGTNVLNNSKSKEVR